MFVRSVITSLHVLANLKYTRVFIPVEVVSSQSLPTLETCDHELVATAQLESHSLVHTGERPFTKLVAVRKYAKEEHQDSETVQNYFKSLTDKQHSQKTRFALDN